MYIHNPYTAKGSPSLPYISQEVAENLADYRYNQIVVESWSKILLIS